MRAHEQDIIRSASSEPSFGEVLNLRLSRRDMLRGTAALGAMSAVAPGFIGSAFEGKALAAGAASSLNFSELKRIYDTTHHVSPGFAVQVVARWGDKLAPDAPAFDPTAQTEAGQAKQFGYNNDYIAFMPLPYGSGSGDHGLLCVNHEYPDPHIMFPDLLTTEDDAGKAVSKDQVDIVMAAMGHSVVELVKKDGKWAIVEDSPYNRRITVNSDVALSGPAAGHALTKTNADPTGTKVKGICANCAGGYTPWGTVLTCEEFSYENFGGDIAKTGQQAAMERATVDGSDYNGFARFHDRFNVEKEPNEPNRFNWVIEIDPYEPQSTPVKRTALGRFGHEGATVVLNKDGRAVVYMGDDDYFEYLYRFVSKNPVNMTDRKANAALLDEGTLSVAKFEADGTLNWLPLSHGEGPLNAENGFADQGQVLVNARLAADKLGATPMDRPEDIETNPVTGRVYAVLTKNAKRKSDAVNAPNPRPENKWGHIVELIPPGEGKDADHAAGAYKWDIFIICGDPSKPDIGAKFHPETTADGWFVTPDNITFDPKGRMFVATDGQNDFDLADGIFAVDTVGPARGLPKALFACPMGAEATGPAFTPDGKTLFVSIQHPGENSENIEKLTTRWPDFDDKLPPRPSVVAIMREDGGEIGG